MSALDALITTAAWISFRWEIARCYVFHRKIWQYFEHTKYSGRVVMSYCPKCEDIRDSHPGIDGKGIERVMEIQEGCAESLSQKK